MQKLSTLKAPNAKVWVAIGVGVAGILILAEIRRRRNRTTSSIKEDFGAFVDRFELLPFPQPPPPAAPFTLAGLTFAISDNIDVKGYVSGHGCADWKRAQAPAEAMAIVVTTMLKNGATCVGKTVMGELGFGLLGENKNYGTPVNPRNPSHFPGGSSSGSAVAVAAHLVDFSLGTDTIGCIRVPALFCGITGFRPSHGTVSTIGVLPNSQSLDTVGCLASDPSILHRVGHALLQLCPLEHKKTRSLVIADDLFQLSKVPVQKTVYAINKAVEKILGYQAPRHINFSQYIASHVPSLRRFSEESTDPQNGVSTLKSLSCVMILLQSFEFKTNHEDWIRSVKPKLGPDVSIRVWEAINTIQKNAKFLYKVRMEMRAALTGLLKDDGILIIPIASDLPPRLNSKNGLQMEFHDRMYSLLCVASLSGGCEVTIPLGTHDRSPVSISFIASHGSDKLLLDTVLDMHSSLKLGTPSSSLLPYFNGNMDTAELLTENGSFS